MINNESAVPFSRISIVLIGCRLIINRFVASSSPKKQLGMVLTCCGIIAMFLFKISLYIIDGLFLLLPCNKQRYLEVSNVNYIGLLLTPAIKTINAGYSD